MFISAASSYGASDSIYAAYNTVNAQKMKNQDLKYCLPASAASSSSSIGFCSEGISDMGHARTFVPSLMQPWLPASQTILLANGKSFSCLGLFLVAIACAALIFTGCGPKRIGRAAPLAGSEPRSHGVTPLPANPAPDPCRVILLPIGGESSLDRKIVETQERIRSAADPATDLERLGWLFVSKARTTFDPGFYKLAELSALCLENRRPGAAEALLLRGHVLQNLHRFKEAEPLARELVEKRGAPFDFGLMGDVLMEQGRLDQAIEAYQKMLNLRPDLHSYSRGAHVRWLRGDVAGAESLMRMAAAAASPLDPDAAAWVNTRLAGYEFQAGNFEQAASACSAALDFQSDYPPALLLRRPMLLPHNPPPDA